MNWTDGSQKYKWPIKTWKFLNILSHKGNINDNYGEIHPGKNNQEDKCVLGGWPLYTVIRSASSHNGCLHGVSSKHKRRIILPCLLYLYIYINTLKLADRRGTCIHTILITTPHNQIMESSVLLSRWMDNKMCCVYTIDVYTIQYFTQCIQYTMKVYLVTFHIGIVGVH